MQHSDRTGPLRPVIFIATIIRYIIIAANTVMAAQLFGKLGLF
jgi:hypothetical protein